MVAEAPQRMNRRSGFADWSRRPAILLSAPVLIVLVGRPDPARPHRLLELLELRSCDILDQARVHVRFVPRALRHRPLAGLRSHHRPRGPGGGTLHDPRLSCLRHHRNDEQAAARDGAPGAVYDPAHGALIRAAWRLVLATGIVNHACQPGIVDQPVDGCSFRFLP
jgi:hypothetical protein